MTRNLRAIYLNDHLAGATAGTELARRARGSNRGSELGEFLEGLAAEIEEDRNSLLEIMSELGVGTDPVKPRVAWAAEKLGRLKPNGQLRGYSPLSRHLELEGLHVGISGKLSLWQSLAATSAAELPGVDVGALVARAERQLVALEPFRIAAARDAFGTGVAAG
jgi:hypothetical protein